MVECLKDTGPTGEERAETAAIDEAVRKRQKSVLDDARVDEFTGLDEASKNCASPVPANP